MSRHGESPFAFTRANGAHRLTSTNSNSTQQRGQSRSRNGLRSSNSKSFPADVKPGVGSYDKFKEMFDRASKEAGKEQYLIPYFIAAHPGTSDADMVELALWLKKNDFRLDQVQTFLPTPLATATAMYHTGKNPLRPVFYFEQGKQAS